MQPREQISTLIPLFILIPLIIVVEGFASIAIEILAIRQLLPFVGSSVVVTSIIIGIFLLFLAMGYHWGGKVQKNLHRALRVNFFAAALFVGLGMSYLAIRYYFDYTQFHVTRHLLWPLIVYLLLVLAPCIFLLGQTLPIVMNIVKQNKSAGAIAGRALGLSTVGSFLGAVMTTLIIMHYFGVAVTVVVVFVLLMLLSMLLSQTKESAFTILCLATSVGILVYGLNVAFEKENFVLTTNHTNYRVLDKSNYPLKDGEKILLMNDTFSSKITADKKGFDYIEKIKRILFTQLKINHANILVLGAGGFSLSQDNRNNNYFTYVDVDDQIKKAVIPKFLDKIEDHVVYADARQFLRTSKKLYGVIVVDTYTNIHSIPSHLLTVEFVQSIRQHLLEHGIAVFNVVAGAFFDDPYSKRIYNTIHAGFGDCTILPKTYAYKPTNVLFVCQKNKVMADNQIYTDNKNTSTVDALAW